MEQLVEEMIDGKGAHVISRHDGRIPIFRLRSVEETEAAYYLLELSRSLPPLPTPGITLHYPTAPAEPIHQTTQPIYNCFGSTDVCYRTATPTPRPVPPLKPPNSEYLLGAENNPPNPQSSQSPGAAAVAVCTYDALLVTDGQSKNRKDRKTPGNAVYLSPSSSGDGIETGIDGMNCDEGGRYTCSECGKKYTTCSTLSRHKNTHRRNPVGTGGTSLDSRSAKKCITCGKAYFSRSALWMHLQTHNLSHTCSVCGKLFSRRWLLQGHMRYHTGEKPYSCALCDKAFADKSNLRAHMQTHSSFKNYQCTRCHRIFGLESCLRKHIKSVHLRSDTGEKLYGCMHCSKDFADRSNLRSHMQTHSSDKNYQCNRCHKPFARKVSLNKHLKSACTMDPFENSVEVTVLFETVALTVMEFETIKTTDSLNRTKYS